MWLFEHNSSETIKLTSGFPRDKASAAPNITKIMKQTLIYTRVQYSPVKL